MIFGASCALACADSGPLPAASCPDLHTTSSSDSGGGMNPVDQGIRPCGIIGDHLEAFADPRGGPFINIAIALSITTSCASPRPNCCTSK